jgi:hypothetical protein
MPQQCTPSLRAHTLHTQETAAPAVKPSIAPVEDELDMYGRPKAKLVLPTDALPESEREKIIEAADALPFKVGGDKQS